MWTHYRGEDMALSDTKLLRSSQKPPLAACLRHDGLVIEVLPTGRKICGVFRYRFDNKSQQICAGRREYPALTCKKRGWRESAAHWLPMASIPRRKAGRKQKQKD